MNAITQKENTALAISETELMNVLRNSLYPGAADESIKMVLGYCKASGFDPMQKPVHIVPMYDSKAKQMRDVIMPGVNLYRTIAARSGCAGVSEPEFGDDKTDNIGGIEITYPLWCKVTVKRRLDTGDIVEFTAKEFWKENYAMKGGQEKSVAPNSMWARRPYAQIAKCAEAQALRKAFPEVGAQPTADEMEGKSLEANVIDSSTGEVTKTPARAEKSICTDEKFDENRAAWREIVKSGKKTTQQLVAMLSSKTVLTEDQLVEIDSWNHEEQAA
jgi:phage recombination protein Bet